MENASKALLIAGSVLIAILLIAMGMRIFTSTKGTTESAETVMVSAEAAMFNKQFNPYIGTSVKGSDVTLLIQKINASNAVNSHKVDYSGLSTLTAKNTEKYTVNVEEYDNGYIKIISISENP